MAESCSAKPRAIKQAPRSLARPASPASRELDRNLEEVLASLSQLLVSSGYGFHRTVRLMKLAFARAARDIENSASRASIARIAASTGMTRIEVSRLLRPNSRTTPAEAKPHNRAVQVALGWISDPQYSNSAGEAALLQFDGRQRSFSKLVRAYSGDIPARAMLTEMKRLRMVRQDRSGLIRLLRTEAPVPRASVSALRAIRPWVSQLAQFSQAPQDNDLISSTNHVTLGFESLPQALASLRLLEERRVAFLEAIAQLGGHSADKKKYGMQVTVAVAAASPSQIRRRTSRKKKGR